MKKAILLIFLLIFGIYLMAQKNCTDAVHPTNYRASILNCCIKEIKNGNIVVYSKDGIDYEIEAISINLNRAFYALKEPNDSIRNIVLLNNDPAAYYKDHPYEYNQELYRKANNRHIFGIVISVAGGGMLIGGIAIMNKKFKSETYSIFESDSTTSYNGVGLFTSLNGIAFLAIGIPNAITYGYRKRKYKHTMEEIKRQGKLSMGLSSNGVGLVLTF